MRLTYISMKVYALTFTELGQLAADIIASMTGSSSYTTPVPSLITLGMLLTAFNDAVTAWGTTGNHGTSQQYRLLLDARTALEAGLTQLAFYAESTTPGQRTIIGSVFPLIKESTPVGILQAVRNLRQFVSREVPFGHIKTIWNKPEGTSHIKINSYIVMRAATNDYSQASYYASVTKTTFTDTNPLPGVNYYWVIPVGAAGNGIVSSICAAIAAINPA